MANAEILAKVILDIEKVIAEHLETGRVHPEITRTILKIMDEAKAVEAAERVRDTRGQS